MGSLSGITGWLQHNALTVVVLFIGLMILLKAHSQNHRGAMVTIGILLMGLAVVGLAVGGNAIGIGNWLDSLFTG